ncbi:hypothetical protein NE237_000584 [Protea cynaroides]|uniref:Uncharacterized protein n=1 Tax=Protea cynaroides TaxID=273540 RepID=A0A9Q0QXB7_9MAGN|nr:hypothetical protein NE237_000584 [Protea cynaroides]
MKRGKQRKKEAERSRGRGGALLQKPETKPIDLTGGGGFSPAIDLMSLGGTPLPLPLPLPRELQRSCLLEFHLFELSPRLSANLSVAHFVKLMMNKKTGDLVAIKFIDRGYKVLEFSLLNL